MQEDQFWKKFIFDSFDLGGVFWELQKIGIEHSKPKPAKTS